MRYILVFNILIVGVVVSSIAGGGSSTGTSAGYIDGTGSVAEFNGPVGVAQDSLFNLYVADSGNNLIRMISSIGTVTTLAGGNGGTTAGTSNGIGTSATFISPQSLAIDPSGLMLYLGSQSDHQIRRILISTSMY